MEVAVQYVREFRPLPSQAPLLPFVPRGKWAARIFHAVPPHVVREKFAETKVIEVDPPASWLASSPSTLLRFDGKLIALPLGKFRNKRAPFLIA